MIRNNPARISEIRSRLSDISWWMRLLSQNIAQRANKDDQEIGKFWQARYRAVRLLDETALLACAAYVDLNPIRAALAETLEASDFTSVQKRIQGLQAQVESNKEQQNGSEKTSPEKGSSVKGSSARTLDAYLAPLAIDERTDALGPCGHTAGQRASDKGFLPIPVAAYIELLDWTARQLRGDKRGATPAGTAPIFERLGISGQAWCSLIKDFGRLFYAVAGQPHEIDARRSRDGQRRYKAKRAARELLAA